MLYSLTPENPEIVTEPSFTDAAGEVHRVQYVTRAIFDDDGNVVEYQSVGRDVTAQRQAEATLEEARSAMARASRVTTFAVVGGGIAHEINQPLNAIRLLAASALLLADRSENPDKKIVRILQNIAGQVDRIDSIVNHLREHLRNNQTVTGELCNLGKAVESALSLMRAQMVARGIGLELTVDPEIKLVVGTSIRFEELVMNLVANAMQALETCDSCPKTISIRVVPQGSDSVELSVLITVRDLIRNWRMSFLNLFFNKVTGLFHGPRAVYRTHNRAIRRRVGRCGEPSRRRGITAGHTARRRIGRSLKIMRILLVDDDAPTRDSLAEYLTLLGMPSHLVQRLFPLLILPQP